jgi:hypothetical protein
MMGRWLICDCFWINLNRLLWLLLLNLKRHIGIGRIENIGFRSVWEFGCKGVLVSGVSSSLFFECIPRFYFAFLGGKVRTILELLCLCFSFHRSFCVYASLFIEAFQILNCCSCSSTQFKFASFYIWMQWSRLRQSYGKKKYHYFWPADSHTRLNHTLKISST